jgi:hypothetical protein
MWFENRAARDSFLGGLESIASLDAEIADAGHRMGPRQDR